MKFPWPALETPASALSSNQPALREVGVQDFEPHQRVVDNVATVPVLKGESRRSARKAALELMKDLKEFRKVSVEESKK